MGSFTFQVESISARCGTLFHSLVCAFQDLSLVSRRWPTKVKARSPMSLRRLDLSMYVWPSNYILPCVWTDGVSQGSRKWLIEHFAYLLRENSLGIVDNPLQYIELRNLRVCFSGGGMHIKRLTVDRTRSNRCWDV